MYQKSDLSYPKISELAVHFNLSCDTTRSLLNSSGINPVSRCPNRYCWGDIWRLEGEGHVPHHLQEEYQSRLLKPREVVQLYFPHISPRAVIQRANRKTLPGILLGTDWRFRECDVRPLARHG